MPTKLSKPLGELYLSLQRPSSRSSLLHPQLNSATALCFSIERYRMLTYSVAVGLRCSDGVILGVERLLHSKLLVKGANKRIQSVDSHIGLATAGLLADGKHLAGRGREEAYNFRDQYAAPVPVNVS